MLGLLSFVAAFLSTSPSLSESRSPDGGDHVTDKSSRPASASRSLYFVDAPGVHRGLVPQISATSLSVQFETRADAERAAVAQKATYVHLPHISAFKGFACGYFSYIESLRSTPAVQRRRERLENAEGLRYVGYVYRTQLQENLRDSRSATTVPGEQRANPPNDPHYKKLWGMRKISGPSAWSVHNDASDVIAVVIDSGINLKHPDLRKNLWTNPKEIPGNNKDDDNNGFVDDVHGIDVHNNDGDPSDANGHGSHCAGTVGGHGNNGFGVVGVAWKVQLLGCQNMGGDGVGEDASVAKCFDYILGLKKRGENIVVTSNSYTADGDDPNMRAGFEAASKAGIMHACAAGNASQNLDREVAYPAGYDWPEIISVMSTDERDRKADSSSYGKLRVDLAAPGVEIYSCAGTGRGFNYKSGTSMATPHVAGALALMISYAKTAETSLIRKALLDTVDKVPGLAKYSVTGGRMNVSKALAALEKGEAWEDEGTPEEDEESGSTDENSTGKDDSSTSEADSSEDSNDEDPDDSADPEDSSASDNSTEKEEPDSSSNTKEEGDQSSSDTEPGSSSSDAVDEDEDSEDSDTEDSDSTTEPQQDGSGSGGCGCESSPLSHNLAFGVLLLLFGRRKRMS